MTASEGAVSDFDQKRRRVVSQCNQNIVRCSKSLYEKTMSRRNDMTGMSQGLVSI